MKENRPDQNTTDPILHEKPLKDKDSKSYSRWLLSKYKMGDSRSSLAVFISWGMLIAFSSCLSPNMDIVQTIDEVFEPEIHSIEADTGFLDVSFEGDENTEELHFTAQLESNSGNTNIKYRIVGNKLIIELKQNGGSIGGRRSRGYIRLKGNPETYLDFNNGSGIINVSNVKNNGIQLSTNSGKIKTANIMVENIHLSASSGEIDANTIKGNVKATVSSGKFKLSFLDGNIDATGSSGQILLDEIEGKVNANISSGEIRLSHIGEIGNLLVSSGKIVANHAFLGPDTALKASSGLIEIYTPSSLNQYNFNLKAGSGSLRVGNIQSGNTLIINNGSPNTIRGEVGSGKIIIHEAG